MDPDGARRLNRSSPSCLNSGAQRTDFFHGLFRVPPLVAVFLAVASTGALVAEQAPELRQAAERGNADA